MIFEGDFSVLSNSLIDCQHIAHQVAIGGFCSANQINLIPQFLNLGFAAKAFNCFQKSLFLFLGNEFGSPNTLGKKPKVIELIGAAGYFVAMKGWVIFNFIIQMVTFLNRHFTIRDLYFCPFDLPPFFLAFDSSMCGSLLFESSFSNSIACQQESEKYNLVFFFGVCYYYHKKGRGAVNIIKELWDKSLPNFGYVIDMDSGLSKVVILGGQSISKGDISRYREAIFRRNSEMQKLYCNIETLSDDQKAELGHLLKRMYSICECREEGLYTREEQAAFIETLSIGEKAQLEYQLQMLKECRRFYRDYVYPD